MAPSRSVSSICFPLYRESGRRVIGVVGDTAGVVRAMASMVGAMVDVSGGAINAD